MKNTKLFYSSPLVVLGLLMGLSMPVSANPTTETTAEAPVAPGGTLPEPSITSVDELTTDGEAAPDATSTSETPAEDAPEDAMSLEEVPAEETPAAETPTEEVPAEETPAEDAPEDAMSLEEVPAEETSAEDAPTTDTPATEAPVEETPEAMPSEEDNTSSDASSSPDVVATEIPAAEAPATEVPTPEAPAETPAPEAPAEAPTTEESPTSDASSNTVVDVAGSNEAFSTLVSAIDAAGLKDTLMADGNFTVFAPTNEAFEALPPGMLETLLKPENKTILAKVLTHHVLGDKRMSSELSTEEITSLAESALQVKVDDSGVGIDEAKVLQADVPASNGVIHVIDKVLIPQELRQ